MTESEEFLTVQIQGSI